MTSPDSPADCILHIGAPKCGSSALQTALSRQPRLTGTNGRKYRYVVYRTGTSSKMWRLPPASAARRSAYGYISWPNVGATEDTEALWSALQEAVRQGQQRGYTPILSNEGWIAHAESFQKRFLNPATTGPERRADVIAFVRPPLDWLNAAYWQWGVWGGINFNNWITRPPAQYRLGTQLARWAEVPGVRLRVRPAQQDVIRGFGDLLGADITGGQSKEQVSNASSPPELIGFLLRNRRFRPTAHNASVEFVFQRWCHIPNAAKLWAFLPRHVRQIREAFRADVDRMMQAIDPVDARVLATNPRWYKTTPYHAALEAPKPDFEDREGLARLYTALSTGLAACATAARQPCPQIAPAPAASASVDAWDSVLAVALERLIELDEAWRRGRWLSSRLGRWLIARLPVQETNPPKSNEE